MLFAIFIVFLSLIALVTLHELGHFLLAKKFGVPVEEFGIGFPPRLFGKKFGETVYSLNLLPLGAFVKIYGEEGGIEDSLSFSQKPIWQRALIVLGGVLAFWIIAIILLSIISSVRGLPAAVVEDASAAHLKEAKVQILEVLAGSPAERAGISPFDMILQLKSGREVVSPVNIGEVQDFIQRHKDEQITISLFRGKGGKEKTLKVTPNKEGKIGVGLVVIGFKTYPWYLSLGAGIETTGRLTYGILKSLGMVLGKAIKGQKVEGMEVRGPIGIGELMTRYYQLGGGYFVYMVSLISIYLAIFNLLPIPAVDGGRFLFLGIEKIRGRPIAPKVEQKINAIFFMLLLVVLVLVSIKDIMRLF